MANSQATNALSLFLLLTLSLLLITATSVPEDELSAALNALRNHGGYSLFANAVATSDLYFSLLQPSLSSFSLFAPPDPSVYSLDYSSSSSDDYITSLLRHVVPRRLSLLSLRSAPAGSDLPTLVPGNFLRVQTRLSSSVVSVSGVDVTSPGLFYGRSVAVHGLSGSVVPRRPPPAFSDRSVEAGSPVVPRHPPPSFPDHSVSDPSEGVSPVVPRHRHPPPSDLSDRAVTDPTEAVSPVVPRHRSRSPPDFPDRTVSDHLFADSPEISDSPVVPRHHSHQPPNLSAESPRNSDSPVMPRHRSHRPPNLSDGHLVADSPRNPVRAGQVEVTPASSIGESPESTETAHDDVAGTVKEAVGHVIMARGNTYRLEEQQEGMLTCPYL